MPDSIDLHVKNIQSKLQLLLKKHALLLKENEQLRKENQSLQINEKTLIDKTEQLQQQVNILKTSAGQMEGKEKMDFEKNINRYIRSIDKCIGILNK
jgi:predicted secreted Zn-dependent protease